MFDSPLSRSTYEVLGVEPSADDDALRRAFRLRLRQTHPDAGGEAAEFIDVQRAWELVGTVPAAITPLTGVRALPIVVASRSALGTVLRRGVPGARTVGGNELFDVRTRLQQAARIVG